jgi:uncharacterized protein YlaI
MRLEVVWFLQMLSQYSVIVNLSINCECDRAVFVDERLCSSVDTDNAQTFMCKDCTVSDEVATPIRTSMSHLLSHAQGSGLELLYIGMTGAKSELEYTAEGSEAYWWQAKMPHMMATETECFATVGSDQRELRKLLSFL